MDFTQSLIAALRGGESPTVSEKDPGIVQGRQAYTNYVIDCQSNGQTPLPFNEWVSSGSPASCGPAA